MQGFVSVCSLLHSKHRNGIDRLAQTGSKALLRAEWKDKRENRGRGYGGQFWYFYPPGPKPVLPSTGHCLPPLSFGNL